MYIFTNPYKSLCSFEETIAPGGSADAPKGDAPKLSKTETLNKAIEDAASQATKELTKEVLKDEKKEEPKAEEKSEKKESDEKVEEDDLNEEQLKYAKTLFKALSNPDPKIQRQTLELFAKASGLEIKDIETKKEATEAKETLVDLLKAGLGEYDFLADKLGPVLEKVVKKFIDDGTKDIREELKQTKEEKIKDQISSDITVAFDKYDNAVEVKAVVLRLMDEVQKTDKISYAKYFDSLIKLAADEKGLTLKAKGSSKKTEIDKDKVDKNRNDVGTRLSSDRTAEAKEGVKSSQRKSLDRAVRDAVEETLQKMNT